MDIEQTKEAFNILSAQAVDLAKKQGIEFDFSNESVEVLEELLGKMHEEIKKSHPTEEQFSNMANIFGAYLGTTFIKNLKKGFWDKEVSHNSWAVNVDNNYIYFPSRVYRRLKSGAENNVIQLYLYEFNKFAEKPISLKIID